MSPTKNNDAPAPTGSYRDVWWTSRRNLLGVFAKGLLRVARPVQLPGHLCSCAPVLLLCWALLLGQLSHKGTSTSAFTLNSPGFCPCCPFQHPHKGSAMGHASGKLQETPTGISCQIKLSRAAFFWDTAQPCPPAGRKAVLCQAPTPWIPWSTAWTGQFSQHTHAVISDGSSRG